MSQNNEMDLRAKIAHNYKIFGNEARLNENITIMKGGSCAIGGTIWSHDYIVYYQNIWTHGITLYANCDKSYVCVRNFESDDLHDPTNLGKLVEYIEEYSKTLLHVYNICKTHFNVKRISHLDLFFIDHLAVYIAYDKSIKIEDSNAKKVVKTFKSVEEMIKDNDMKNLMSYYTRFKIWCGEQIA
jgi:hypothetical protein